MTADGEKEIAPLRRFNVFPWRVSPEHATSTSSLPCFMGQQIRVFMPPREAEPQGEEVKVSNLSMCWD